MSRKLFVYIATSIDGYIARRNDDIGWLSLVEKDGEDYGYYAFMKTIDTVIIGRRTYDKVMMLVDEFPHADKNCYVITSSDARTEGTVHFYNGDLTALVEELKQQSSDKQIFCDGGAQIVNQLAEADLIDEYIISIIPIMLGDGIRLFDSGRPSTLMHLVEAKHFDTGLVQLHYARAR